MLNGRFGPVHPFRISGWAYDGEAPDAPVAVEVLLDGELLGTVHADGPSADPAAGGARRGFVLNTSRRLPTDDIGRLAIVAHAADGRSTHLAFAPPAPAPLRFPLPASDPAQRPVFILGSIRSGTTAVMHALRTATRYAGPGEGHLLDMAAPLLWVVARTYEERDNLWSTGLDTMIAAVPQSFMTDAVRHGFVELARALFPTPYWLDKTPTSAMILAAPVLKIIWPEARFVFLKRRAIENVLSRLRRFPQTGFADHCRDWAAAMDYWEQVRGHLGASAEVIEHFDLAREPARIAETLSALLTLDGHEEDGLRDVLSSARPERSSDDFAAIRSLEGAGWSPEQVALFRTLCGPAMRRAGYGEGETYFEGG